MRKLILILGFSATVALAQNSIVLDGNGSGSVGQPRPRAVFDGSNGGDIVGKHGAYGVTPEPTGVPTATPTPTSTPTPTNTP